MPLSETRVREPPGSQPEFANIRLVEAEVVTSLVTHRLHDLQPEALGIVPEITHERVSENQDLVGNATAPKETATAHLEADVQAIRVVLGTAVGNDHRDVLQRMLKLARQTVERRTNELLKFLLAVVPVSAHDFMIAPSVAHPALKARSL
jgi:hypothetical protein